MTDHGKLTALAIFIVGLACACTNKSELSAAADAPGGHFERPAVKALDPSDPAQAAVIRWHQALVADHFAEYSEVAVRGADEGDGLRVVGFDRMRQGLPPAVLAHDGTHDFDKLISGADGANLEGLKTFSLVGCVQSEKGRSVRVMSVVGAREIEGRWRVYGGSFGLPSTPFSGGCPVRKTKSVPHPKKQTAAL